MLPPEIRVSYLITTRNRASFLERTLSNVREFIEPKDELIIIDGGSTDDTGNVVAKNRDLVTVFVSENDLGEAHAFNKGLFRARGKYIKPITDDDYFFADSMRRLIAEMESRPDVDAIQCGGEIVKSDNEGGGSVSYRCLKPDVVATGETICWYAVSGLGLIFRRSVIEITGGVSNDYVAVDADLLCRMVQCKCVVRYLDIAGYRWQLYPHSGCNKVKRFQRDDLHFSVRLGRWDHLVRIDPEIMAEAAIVGADARERALFQWIWIAGFLSRTVFWRLGPALCRLLRSGRSLKRYVEKSARVLNSPRKTCSAHEWTGKLR